MAFGLVGATSNRAKNLSSNDQPTVRITSTFKTTDSLQIMHTDEIENETNLIMNIK
jgi:hypothetical protein